MSELFSPLKIRNITLKNRIAMSPMCQYSATEGFANDWHLAHYGARATGGTGLIIVEATGVTPNARISPGDLGLWKDEQIAGLKRITEYIHRENAVAAIQLAHAGRKASCALPVNGGKQLRIEEGGWQTVAPSDIPFLPGERNPQALDEQGITEIVNAFSSAAARAVRAGFDVIEIHSAHGYLLHEFLSPLSNKRTDLFGGSFENRIRLLVMVCEAVRNTVPDSSPLFVRLSSTDWTEGGWTLDETVKLAGILKAKGVDLIDCSSGGNVHDAKIPAGPGYQLPFSEAVKKSGIMAGAVGFITGARQAETVISEGKADLVFLGRELLRNPYFALSAARELGAEIAWPSQYLRARPV
jgi:2,4-dienoyl-CoA reductase-like NADH-dependent reductase (Old Yellow Enzyme family)